MNRGRFTTEGTESTEGIQGGGITTEGTEGTEGIQGGGITTEGTEGTEGIQGGRDTTEGTESTGGIQGGGITTEGTEGTEGIQGGRDTTEGTEGTEGIQGGRFTTEGTESTEGIQGGGITTEGTEGTEGIQGGGITTEGTEGTEEIPPASRLQPPAAGLRLRRRRSRSGLALLVVIACVMILTVLVTDIGFGARVRFLGAVHQRDQHQAHWLANTGANVYRLILIVNKQLASQLKSLASAAEGSPYAAMLALIDLKDPIVSMVPMINTGLMRLVFATGGDVDEEDAEEIAKTGELSEEMRAESMEESSTRFDTANFLDFDGDFSAEVQPENCRINVNQLSSVTTGALTEHATAKMMYAVMSGEENETWLRERNLDAWDLIGNLADWVDTNSDVATGKGGYEDGPYQRLDSPYMVKNAKFDTPSEIRLVEGWQDDVLDRFGKEFTIFGNDKVNINCADDEMIKAMLRAYAGVSTDQQAQDLMDQLNEYKQTTPVRGADGYISWMESAGLTVDAALKKVLTDENTHYTVTSTGVVGDAMTTLTVVVNMSKATGKVEYYRVD